MGLEAQMDSAGGEESCPDSWEMADLEGSMVRLMPPAPAPASASPASSSGMSLEPSSASATDTSGTQVDEFLREALQNPHDRMTILRLEQEVQKFVKNPAQHQLEFAPMASSYMRLAAHRVAQHYNLQTSVLDSSSAEGCRIIVHKTVETRCPAARLSDVPVTSYQVQEDTNETATKFVIKQRPQGRFGYAGNGTASGSSNNPSKSVEERNEEYNRARARIFRTEKEKEQRAYDELVELENKQQCSKVSETTNKDSHENASVLGKKNSSNSRTVKEPPAFSKSKQKVAIFRDREKDRKDPDYDRNYDRYSQRFDPGFGLGNTPQPAFGVQARYTPVVNYNTEFPTLGGPPVRPMQGHMGGQHVQGWNPGYQRQRDMLRPSFNPAGPHSNMATYMSQYASYPQAYAYSSQISQLPEAGSSQARRR